jgi:regulator of sirC expression with transglutaminase-like and TPR domain
MKIFLKKTKNTEAKAMLENVLEIATKEVDNADVRDRGFIYLRLLTNTPEVAKQV